MTKRLQVFPSLGNTFAVGWLRDDVPMIHTFANVAPGTRFQPSDGKGGPHWPCSVCKAHEFTEQDFVDQIHAALARGPEPTEAS